MMKFLIPLLCIPLFGMDNAQAVKNPTAVALTNHPKTLFFHLAKGEVRNFPRPYAKPSTTGVRSSIPNWQADVKSRWRDAFKTVSITKIRISDPVASIDGGTLTSIVVNNTTSGDTTVNINNAGSPNPFGPEMKRGDPFTIEGASLDNDLNRTHYVVTSNPTTVGNITSFSTRAQATTARTYNNAGLLLRWTLDPYASGQCRFVAPNHGFEVSEQVTISGVTGVTGANGTWRVSAISKDEFVINTSCAGTYSGGGTITGPDFGSVRWAHVSVILPTIPGNGETKVDVVNSTDACHLGSQTTCRNASTSVATLLSEVPWGMQLQAKVRTGPSTESTKVVDLRTKLGNWNGVESYCGTRYWLRGPVVTELIVEGGNYNGVTHDCETDNFGWKNVISGMTTPLTGNYITTAICGTTDASCATSTTEFDIFDDPNFVVGDLLWFNTTHGTQPPLPASYVTSFTIEVMQVVSIVGHHITVTRGYDNSSTMTAIPVNRKFGVFKWEDSDVTGWKDGIHPSFSLRYYPDWAGVRLSARLENPYWDRTASIWYSLDILTSNNVGGTGLTPRLSYGYTEHPHKARHQFQMWVNNDADHRCKDGAGTDPENCATTGGGVRALRTIVDMNRAYLQYSGLLPEREMNDLTAEADRFVHGTTVTDTFYPGFFASDKGAWGVRKRVNASQTVAYSPETFVPYHPFYWPGEGTVNNWGTKGAVWVAARDWQSDNSSPIGSWKSSEGWWPMDSDAVALHCNFCESGYELSISPSTPGGGGNAMAEAHTIMFPKENQSRIYVAGWPDLGVGRGISLHGRPQVSTALGKWYSVYTAQDEPMVACSPTVAIPGSVWASTIIYWPCWAGAGSADPSYVSTGGLPPEQGHLGIYGLLGWIMSSGDFFYYEGITLEAHTVAGLAYNLPAVSAMIGRPIGTRWAGMGANANHMRMEAMPMMVLASGLTVAITEPLFGQTYMPERLLLNDYAWKVGLKREGDMSFRNGWAEQLFPSHFTFSCAGFSSVVTSPTVSDPYRKGCRHSERGSTSDSLMASAISIDAIAHPREKVADFRLAGVARR
jgi:hypothetical protein